MHRKVSVLLIAVVAVCLAYASNSFAADVKIGEKAPDFKAIGIDGKSYSLESAKDAEVVVVCFTCNNCPVAKAYEDRFIAFSIKYEKKGVKFLAINVNENEDLTAMKERAQEKDFSFPYAYDASGDSARAYGAKVTPHIFVLDQNRKIAYMGSFDDKMNDPSKHFAVDAVEAILAGKTPDPAVTKEVGCGIKPRTE